MIKNIGRWRCSPPIAGCLTTRRVMACRSGWSAWNCTGRGYNLPQSSGLMVGGALQTYMIRELLALHGALVDSLKLGRAVTCGRFPDTKSAELMAALAGDHEKDAFMLRALLWEVENTSL